MNVDTGEIKQMDELTMRQLKSAKWLEVPKEHAGHLQGLNRKQRRQYLKEHGQFKKGKWGWL